MVMRVAIVGAGGFGRETYDLIRSCDTAEVPWDVAGFVDDKVDGALLASMGSKWLGTDDDFLSTGQADSVLIAVGDPFLREKLTNRYRAAGVSFTNFVHPSAMVGSNVDIGEGCIVSAGVMLMNNVRLGSFSNIDRRCMVGHDSVVEDYGTLHPGSVVSGRVCVGPFCILGTCSCVLPGIALGASVVVGAGAVVVRSFEGGETVVGVPARPIVRQ